MIKKIAPVLFVLMISGCTSDDNAIDPGSDTWVLNNAICFCFFGDDFDFGAHTLQFNSETKMVTIENGEDSQFIAPSGTYAYSDNGSEIGIDGRQYTYSEDGDSMVLTYVDNPQIADDEVTYYYSKN